MDTFPLDLLPSWTRSLRATGKSPRTVDSYAETLRAFAAFCPLPIDRIERSDVENWIVELLDTRSAGTARLRYASLRQFFRWAESEGEIPLSPMTQMRPPSTPQVEVPIIADHHLSALLECVDGSGFNERRDAAIIWVLLSTGIRAAELVGMTLASVDLDSCTISVRGKGAKDRTVGIGDRTILALDRYGRSRSRHPHARLAAFWLGPRGPITDSGLRQIVRRRGDEAGIEGLHPHRFRHTFSHRWLAKGGTEGGLQTVAGWASPQMVARYGASAKAERARAEAARLGLEEF